MNPHGRGSFANSDTASARERLAALRAAGGRVLLGGALALLGAHVWGYLRAGRPTDLTTPHRIDINRADRAELLQIPGIGPVLAERIEDYRREHGGFHNVDELRRVRGIGPATLDRMRPWVCVEGEEEQIDDEPLTPTAAKVSMTPTGGKKGDTISELIDVNTATAAELRGCRASGRSCRRRSSMSDRGRRSSRWMICTASTALAAKLSISCGRMSP